MSISRRQFLRSSAALSLGFAGLRCRGLELPTEVKPEIGLGLLLDDPNDLVALPQGFTYKVISSQGEQMTDGFIVPALHDGMGAFHGPNGTTILVRNHEVYSTASPGLGAFGENNELLSQVDQSLLYDTGAGGGPALGGTTTLVFDTQTQSLESHHLSLAGTLRNCSGGITPWGSWITCEETTERVGHASLSQAHGYPFEVHASAERGLQQAIPLTAMGRFNREAIAVDAQSGIVYQTEDLSDGLLYRYIPEIPGRLEAGGEVQALVITGRPSLDTRNWEEREVYPGSPMDVEWVTLDDVTAPSDDLRFRGFGDGAARFARAEGIWYGNGEIYIVCTNGGPAQQGQVWRYEPKQNQYGSGVADTLELFLESNDNLLLHNGDNITIAPWGDLIICEDGVDGIGHNRVVGITPTGEMYEIIRNMKSTGEFTGICFSPDGTTLFVNMQLEGLTVAVTGDWSQRHGGISGAG
jgi:secreted PhoX family phosphatase